MKNLFTYIIVSLAILSSLAGCKDDFLDTKPSSEISSADTWKDGSLSEAFVNGVYAGLGNGGFDEQMLSSLSDESVFTHAGRGINIINEGILNPSNLGWTNNTYEWKNMYNYIRAANIAITTLPAATFDDAALKKRLRGEAHFLRAFYFHQLVRYYGGVPIVDKVYGLTDDYAVERNNFSDCVDFIVKSCDSAALLLGETVMQKGRASKAAALALKARILLYAASDLHDMPTAKAASTLLNGFTKSEFLGYTSGDRVARWTAAKNAALVVLNLGGGYKLDLTAPVSAEEGQKNYIALAMGGGSKVTDAAAGSELFFLRNFTANKDEYAGMYVGLTNGPNGYHNWAGNSPMQLLVDDYEMADGTKFSWDNAAQKAAPYKNRDPRFYGTVLYDGAPWKPRNKVSGNVDPANQIQTGQYQTAAGTIAGLDTRQSSIENWNGSWTGYYMRKFIDPNPDIADNSVRQFVPWPFLRYTEAVLNYAEACIELGQDTEARLWLNKIRFRAGMPAITESGAALKQRYRNERRIELAYEEHRYHDARRWMVGAQTLGRKLIYIKVTGTLKPGATAPSPYKYDETAYTYQYLPVEDNSLENRTWVDKMYYRPVSRDEMNKNGKLVQNPGY